eukprot:6188348-Pleurochrysis_carterae.AAC.1
MLRDNRAKRQIETQKIGDDGHWNLGGLNLMLEAINAIHTTSDQMLLVLGAKGSGRVIIDCPVLRAFTVTSKVL